MTGLPLGVCGWAILSSPPENEFFSNLVDSGAAFRGERGGSSMGAEMGSFAQNLGVYLTQMGLKVLWALVLWLVGRRLIGFSINMLRAALLRQSVDPTLIRWQVYFDTNRTIRGAFGEAGFPVPEQHYVVQPLPAAQAAPRA
jgi:hypothetical protein